MGGDRWPQQTHLSLVDAETRRTVARGEPFALAVAVARGESVPSSASATYRFDEWRERHRGPPAAGGGLFRGRIESVTRPFTFSVAAGDDSTSIRNVAVKVVPPPTLTDLTVRLISPSYTGLPEQTLASGRTQVRAVEGTRVVIEARANKPIATASLHLGEKPAGAPIEFDAARRVLKTRFTVKGSAPFWFDLLDTEGFRNREAVRYDVRSLRDEAPRVVLDEPTSDRDVPAQAVVPVRFTVDDDYGIQSARLLYKVATGGSEPTREVAVPLWDSQGNPPGAPVKHQEVGHAWDLAPLKLAPGTIITFHADARDFDDLQGPNLGKSRELRLRIVSDEDIARQLDDQRRAIREETERILAMQKQAITPVEDALRILEKTGQLARPAADELKNGEMIQRQVGSRINSRTDGLDQKIRRFLDDLQNFKMPNPDAQKQMEEMRAGVERVRENHLGQAEASLTRASKSLGEPSGAKPDAAERPGPRRARPAPAGDKPDGARRRLPPPRTRAPRSPPRPPRPRGVPRARRGGKRPRSPTRRGARRRPRSPTGRMPTRRADRPSRLEPPWRRPRRTRRPSPTSCRRCSTASRSSTPIAGSSRTPRTC